MFNLTPWNTRKLPVRREEEHPVYSLQREMNRVFEDFFRTPALDHLTDFPSITSEQFFSTLTPRVDVSETDKELLVKVELPGMTEKDINISVNREMLTISGEKKQEKEQNEKDWYRLERQYGSFSRSIPLPFEVQADQAEALYKGGVLTVKLPKSAAQQKSVKSIEVKSA